MYRSQQVKLWPQQISKTKVWITFWAKNVLAEIILSMSVETKDLHLPTIKIVSEQNKKKKKKKHQQKWSGQFKHASISYPALKTCILSHKAPHEYFFAYKQVC